MLMLMIMMVMLCVIYRIISCGRVPAVLVESTLSRTTETQYDGKDSSLWMQIVWSPVWRAKGKQKLNPARGPGQRSN